MFRVDEVITGKEVSVVFNDGNITAGLPEDAKRMFLPESSSSCLLEDLHFDPLDILLHPLIEDGAEKIAESVSGYCAVANAPLFCRLWFNEWKKLHIASLELFEEPVNLGGMLYVLCMHHAQDVGQNSVLP